MKKLALIAGCVCALGIILLVNHQHNERAARQQTQVATHSTSTNSQGQKSTKSSPAKKPTSDSKPKTAKPESPCAAVLSSATAQKVLRAKPAANSGNGITSQTADITVTTCGYTAGTSSASVVLHEARTPVGASSNDIVFGSGRPHDVVSVKGYGSAAFWQQSTGTLNILKGNNWYAIHCAVQSQNSLSAAEKVAAAAHLTS